MANQTSEPACHCCLEAAAHAQAEAGPGTEASMAMAMFAMRAYVPGGGALLHHGASAMAWCTKMVMVAAEAVVCCSREASNGASDEAIQRNLGCCGCINCGLPTQIN